MTLLDDRYPKLSQLVRSVLGIDLEALANRAPAVNYDYFDLERLLAHVRDIADDPVFDPHGKQARGYLATIEAYVALGIVRDPIAFVTKKLKAPKIAHTPPRGSEMLDTLAECSWGLWLADNYGMLEEEKALPGGIGDADFYIITPRGPLWVDCLSVGSTEPRYELGEYFLKKVRAKWRAKFGARPSAATLPAAIAVTFLKQQENIKPAFIRGMITSNPYVPPASLWMDCPGLQMAWFAMPPWYEQPHRPEIFATWERP